MEVRIRLQRAGKGAKKTYNYRVVAISKESPRHGRYLDLLGYYDPAKKPHTLKLDQSKMENWISKGAQMSNTVKSLYAQVKRAS